MALVRRRNSLPTFNSNPTHPSPLATRPECLLSHPKYYPNKADRDEVALVIKSEEDKASHKVDKEMLEELDKIKAGKRNLLLTNLVRGIVSHAVKNGDDKAALGEWKIKYCQLFIKSNQTDLAFDVIRRELNYTLEDVKAGRKLTERGSLGYWFRIKKGYESQELLIRNEADWWHEEIKSSLEGFEFKIECEPQNSTAFSRGETISHFGKLKDILTSRIVDRRERRTFRREFWLKRYHETKVLEYFHETAKLPMFDGTSALPLFRVEAIQRRIAHYKPPAALLSPPHLETSLSKFQARTRGKIARVLR